MKYYDVMEYFLALEGEQAEAYKAKKEAEARERARQHDQTIRRANGSGNEYARNYKQARRADGRPLNDKELDDAYEKRYMTPSDDSKKLRDERRNRMNQGKPMSAEDASHMRSAYNRHQRDLAKRESIDIEDLDFLDIDDLDVE